MNRGLLSEPTIASIRNRIDSVRARFEAHEDITRNDFVQLLADADRLIWHADVAASRIAAGRMGLDGETYTRAPKRKDTQ